jgi:large subunit ribosomal protein L17
MLTNLLKSLVHYEMLQTTDARAKELRKLADRLITLGKRGTVHARRQAITKLGGDRELAAKVFDDLVERDEIAGREGGYCRIVKLGNRRGDNAAISRISWVGATLESTEDLRYPEHIRELIEYEEVDEDIE